MAYPPSVYALTGGFLSDSDTIVEAAIGGGFFQSGGVHIVGNLLHVMTQILNFNGYVLSADTRMVQNGDSTSEPHGKPVIGLPGRGGRG